MKKLMRRVLFTALPVLLMLAVTFSAQAATGGTCGNGVSWELDNNGLLSVTGNGKMADYSTSLYRLR